MVTRSEVEATIRSEEHTNVPIETYHSMCYSLLERAEAAERALALSEQVRSISVRADAYEQKCRQLEAAIERAEVAEMRLKKAMSLLADNRLNLGIHSSHWDDTMQGGRGCRVCIEQRKIMNEIWELESEINGRQ